MSDNTRLSNIDHAIANYLQTASAPTIHVALQSLKQSYFVVIKNNPETEKATALLLYWKMRPRMVKQLMQTASTDAQLNAFAEQYQEILLDLETKYLSGFYTGKTIGYNPYYDYIKDSEYSGKIPAEMFIAILGEEIVPVMYDMKQQLTNGLPRDLYRQITDGTIDNNTLDPEEETPMLVPAVIDVTAPQIDEVLDTKPLGESEDEEALDTKYKLDQINLHGIKNHKDIMIIMDQVVIDYLKTASPKVIDSMVHHLLGLHFECDSYCNMTTIAAYLKNQPETEKATILLLYFCLCPAYSKQYASEHGIKEFDAQRYALVEDIEKRYLSGFYTQQTIAIANLKDYRDDAETADHIKYLIPKEMYQSIVGKKLNPKKFDGDKPAYKHIKDQYNALVVALEKSNPNFKRNRRTKRIVLAIMIIIAIFLLSNEPSESCVLFCFVLTLKYVLNLLMVLCEEAYKWLCRVLKNIESCFKK